MKIVSLADLPAEGVSHDPAIRKQVLLRRGELPHLMQFAQSRLSPGQVARTHVHRDMWEVFLIEQGTGVMRVDGRPHPLAPGLCIAVAPGESHEIVSTGPEELVLTYFSVAV